MLFQQISPPPSVFASGAIDFGKRAGTASFDLSWKLGFSHSLQPDGCGDVRQVLRFVACIVGGDDGLIGGSVYLGRHLGVKVVEIRSSGDDGMEASVVGQNELW
ncbi:hypothetical protein N7501_003278 [Penicillium viridicatum]|nr:hypothetical protein N7501_003278 [Penicillium viridicatum]